MEKPSARSFLPSRHVRHQGGVLRQAGVSFGIVVDYIDRGPIGHLTCSTGDKNVCSRRWKYLGRPRGERRLYPRTRQLHSKTAVRIASLLFPYRNLSPRSIRLPRNCGAGRTIQRVFQLYCCCRLRAAQRAIIKADSLFFAAGLIWRRLAAGFLLALAGLVADWPLFRAAQRAFIALEIRSRAAALITRRSLPVVALAGRLPRGEPSKAAMA